MSTTAERRLAATARHISYSAGAASASGSPTTSASGSPANSMSSNDQKIKNVTVFGAGSMGAGIAQVALTGGFKVVLCDVSQPALETGRKIIIKSLTRRAKSKFSSDPSKQTPFVEGYLKNLTLSTDAGEAVKDADVVIEAIIENVKIKQDLFVRLDKAAKKSCIFTTNTSSLSVSEIGSTVSDDRRRRFGGLHFFNPVPQMKLVEVVRAKETSDEVFTTLFEFGKSLGKVPVACKDTPGFIVNRLLIPYTREAFAMFERGDATAEDIDTAMKLGAGYPMGPLELSDLVGLDISKAIGEAWQKRAQAGDERVPKEFLKPSPLVERLVSEGKLGIKTGEGIFKYNK